MEVDKEITALKARMEILEAVFMRVLEDLAYLPLNTQWNSFSERMKDFTAKLAPNQEKGDDQ